MAFPVDDKELKAAYYHLRNFGQVKHAEAISDFADRFKMLEEQSNLLMNTWQLEKKQPRASYEEFRNKILNAAVRTTCRKRIGVVMPER